MSEPEDTSGAGTPADAARLRAATAADYDRLCRAVAWHIQQADGPMRFDLLRERVEEVVDEAAARALAHAASYDPAQPAFRWVMAFAVRVLFEWRRKAGAARKHERAEGDMAGGAWERVVEQFVTRPAGGGYDDGDVRRVRRAMAQLADEDRRLLALRYERGLKGVDLARAAGVPSAGAARVRLCRALKALRAALDREPYTDEDDDREAGGEEADR